MDEPERVKVMYTAVCLHTGTVPSQRYIREVWRQRVVVCHQGLDHRQGKAIAVSLKASVRLCPSIPFIFQANFIEYLLLFVCLFV